MKTVCCLITLALLTLATPAAQPANTISFDAGQPTSLAPGEVSATGSYALDQGWTVTTVTLWATPPMGGIAGSVKCKIDNRKKAWRGTIDGLPPGTYNVFALMVVTNADGTGMSIFTTPTRQVTVREELVSYRIR